MAPNTFKVAISIFNWPFGSTKSTLSVVFENSLNNEVEDECDTQNYIDSNDNLRWVLFSAGDVSVYSKLVEVPSPLHPLSIPSQSLLLSSSFLIFNLILVCSGGWEEAIHNVFESIWQLRRSNNPILLVQPHHGPPLWLSDIRSLLSLLLRQIETR